MFRYLSCLPLGNVTLGGDVEDVCVWSDDSCAMDPSAYDIEACSEMELTCMWYAANNIQVIHLSVFLLLVVWIDCVLFQGCHMPDRRVYYGP